MKRIITASLLFMACAIYAYTEEQMEEMLEAGQDMVVYEWLNRPKANPAAKPARPKQKKQSKPTKDASTDQSNAQPSTQTSDQTNNTESSSTDSAAPNASQESSEQTGEPVDSQSDNTQANQTDTGSIDSADEIISVEFIESNSELISLIESENSPSEEIVSESVEITPEENQEAVDQSAPATMPSTQLFGMYQGLIDDYDIFVAEGSIKSLKKAVGILKQLATTFKDDADMIENDTDLHNALVEKKLYPRSALRAQQTKLENRIKKLQTKPGVLGWIASWFRK